MARYIDISDLHVPEGIFTGVNVPKLLAWIHSITPAEVEEVKHGMNAAKDYADCDQFVCPICGIELQDWVQVERDEDDGDITYHEYVFKRCPECGAKIDRWENENG